MDGSSDWRLRFDTLPPYLSIRITLSTPGEHRTSMTVGSRHSPPLCVTRCVGPSLVASACHSLRLRVTRCRGRVRLVSATQRETVQRKSAGRNVSAQGTAVPWSALPYRGARRGVAKSAVDNHATTTRMATFVVPLLPIAARRSDTSKTALCAERARRVSAAR